MARKATSYGERNFGWARLVPESTDNLIYEYDGSFEAFMIQVKTDTPEGEDLRNDPLNVLSHIEEIRRAFRLPPKGRLDHPNHPVEDPKNCSEERMDLRATVTRLNAERPANRVHAMELWVSFSDSPPVYGAMQYKFCEKRPRLKRDSEDD